MKTQTFAEWLTILGYSKQRCKQYPRAVERLLNWVNKTPELLLPDEATAYVRYLEQQELKPSYINTQITAFKSYARYRFQTLGRLFPVGHLHYLKVVVRPSVALTLDEVQQLYSVTNNSKYGYRDRAMLAVCYGGGLRRNEMIHLLTTDIDFKHGYVHVRQGKNYKERIVPLPEKALDDLKAYIKHGRPLLQKHLKNQRELFLGYRGKVITAQVYEKRIKELAVLTQNPQLIEKNITLHLLRHSIATHLLDAGIELELVSQLLGHASLRSTQVYLHLTHYENKNLPQVPH